MTESSDMSDMPTKPQDFVSLRAELTALVSDFTPVIAEFWPRLESPWEMWRLQTLETRGRRQPAETA
jgi:hypothetical protein